MTKNQLIESNSIAETGRLNALERYEALRQAAEAALDSLEYVEYALVVQGSAVRRPRIAALRAALA